MLFATFAPGPRPFLRSGNETEVLGQIETAPPSSAETQPIVEVLPTDDWSSTSFGASDLAYGDDPVLDELYDRCTDEDHQACDDLMFSVKDTRSSYELWGLSCGNRSDLITGTCVERFADGEFDPQFDYAIGDCVVLPRSDAAIFRRVDCAQAHDAEVISSLASPHKLKALDGSFYVGPEAAIHMENACRGLVSTLVADEAWTHGLSFTAGVITPTSESTDELFDCIILSPGNALSAPLTGEQ